MKFTCEQSILTKILNTVSKAVTTRTTIPILKGILIKAKGNQVTFIGSDLDISIEQTLNANIEREGSIVVPSKLFTDIIKKLSNEQISIEVLENNNVLIQTTNSEFTIAGMLSDEYPNTLEIENNEAEISIDANLLKNMIQKTSFAASKDESIGVVVGELLELKENEFNMVAVDGFRMSVCREKMKNAVEKNIIIHAEKLNNICNIIKEYNVNEDIKMIFDNKKIALFVKNIKIAVRLIEGDFIKYEDILLKDPVTKIIVDRKEILTSIERAEILAINGKNNLIRCLIEGNTLCIRCRSEEGKVVESVNIEKKGEDLEIGFNSRYLSEALKAIDDDEVMIEFKNPNSPCLIKPIEGNDYDYLILPVRISR